jgi:D-alanyl-D-alanine carboxypeptidase
MRQWLMGAMAAAFLVALPADAKLKSATMVVDADTGEVLQASNVDTQIYPASLTKMMTLYLLFDDLDSGKIHMSDRIPVSDNAEEQAPSSLGLESGQTLSVEEAMYGMIVKSANDAAMAAACAERMTRKAHELGMTHTVFRNPNGLPNPEQHTSARDMATLARALMHNHAKEYHYFSTREFTFRGQVIHGHNHLLEWYKGADGLKTGFINASGFNIVTTAKRDDRHLIAVVLGWPTGPSRDHQVAKLLNAGFARSPGSAGVEMAELPQQEEADEPAVSTRAVMKAMSKSKAKPRSQVAALRADNSVGDTDDDEEWAVQVGSYGQQAKALQIAQAALVKFGKYGEDGEAKAVLTSKKGSKRTYASRVVGLSKEDAQGACRISKKHHQPCRALNLG